jgi:hypothetical protein
MTDPVIPAALDCFRVEIDTKGERADVILDRPPLNVITMPQREQLRTVFEAQRNSVSTPLCGCRQNKFQERVK